jgi:adenosine 3'-phospho 5'-phosphosulfate transporter B3
MEKLDVQQDDDIQFLSLMFGKISPTTRFVVMTAMIFVIWISHSIATEYIFFGYEADQFPFGFVYTMIQFTIYSLISGSVLTWQGKNIELFEYSEKARVPLLWWIYIALLAVMSAALANQSLAFVNFPTLLVFKNCKILFVMLAGFFIFKKKFSRFDLIASLFLVCGLILLSISNLESITFNLTGILLLSSALFADSLLSNMQEKFMITHNISSNQIMFGSQSIAAIILFVISLTYGTLMPGLLFFTTHLMSTFMVALTCLLGYFGCYLVLVFMKQYGAFITVTTTSCRKCMSVLVSFLLFPKPLSLRFALAIVLVFLGVAVNIYSKHRKDHNDKQVTSEISQEKALQDKVHLDVEKSNNVLDINVISSPVTREDV